MMVGVLRVDLSIGDAQSLKDKRRVLKSIKDRLSNTFNVSVAEVDEKDAWQRAVLGIAMVGDDGRYVHGGLDRIVDWLRRQRGVSLIDFEKESR